MTEIIHGDNFRKDLFKAFNEARDRHFNPGRFRGAMLIPMGVPFHVAPRIPTKPVNAAGRILTTDYMMSKYGQKVEDLVRQLADGCFPTPEDRSRMWVPVFRTKPVLEIAPFDAAGWPIGIWCDMVWAPSHADLTGLGPAWE